MKPNDLIESLRVLKVPHDEVAAALGRSRSVATKLLAGERSLKANEIEPLSRLLAQCQVERHALPMAESQVDEDYVPVEVLPTYAGMGGGGTGEGDVEHALVPRYLVEGVLRGHPANFLLVRVRGDSMEPDFRHDDELLVDRRDTSPAQPGPFALWHDDEYVVKNVEKLNDGRVRIFSTNNKYETIDLAREETRMIGRPVWYGRKL